MTFDVLVLMDPIERIDIRADSTFVMLVEAQARGHRIYYAHPKDLYLQGDSPGVRARSLEVEPVEGAHYRLGDARTIELSAFGAILMRKDPPFDTDYLLATLVLDRVDRRRVVLFNAPRALRDLNEKMSALRWSHLMPPTLITADHERIRAFIGEHGACVIKPLLDAGGHGILRLERNDKNTRSALDLLTHQGRTMIEVQAYVAAVEQGDKRILLVDGDAAGAINRVPSPSDLAANMHVGGRAEATELTERDQEICRTLGPELEALGLIFVGLDVIGGYLTEINITSPTGLQEYTRFTGVRVEKLILDSIARRHRQLGDA